MSIWRKLWSVRLELGLKVDLSLWESIIVVDLDCTSPSVFIGEYSFVHLCYFEISFFKVKSLEFHTNLNIKGAQ